MKYFGKIRSFERHVGLLILQLKDVEMSLQPKQHYSFLT